MVTALRALKEHRTLGIIVIAYHALLWSRNEHTFW